MLLHQSIITLQNKESQDAHPEQTISFGLIVQTYGSVNTFSVSSPIKMKDWIFMATKYPVKNIHTKISDELVERETNKV